MCPNLLILLYFSLNFTNDHNCQISKKLFQSSKNRLLNFSHLILKFNRIIVSRFGSPQGGVSLFNMRTSFRFERVLWKKLYCDINLL